MGIDKKYDGYRSFQYLERDQDYRGFELSKADERVAADRVPLSEEEESRYRRLAAECVMVSMHEHIGNFPDRIEETPTYVREGRMSTAFEALSRSCWDAVLDNMMDGICTIESKGGWKWTEVTHDLGMHLADLAHQDFLIHCKGVDDIRRAHAEGRIAWVATIEGAMMIENELDRIEVLYGFGVRSMGVTYSESNGLGSGLIAPGEALGRGKHDVDAPRHRERNLPIRTQRVESRPAKGRATSRKRVLRGVWVTSAAKRRQRACRPLRSSSEKTTSRRPTPLRQRKAASCSRSGLAARLLRGLRTVACTHWGSSGNLGGPVVSVETNRFSGSGRKVQADARRCP